MKTSEVWRAQLTKALLGWMEKKGVTQAEAARVWDMHQSTVSAWIGGHRRFSLGKLFDMWEATGGTAEVTFWREERQDDTPE